MGQGIILAAGIMTGCSGGTENNAGSSGGEGAGSGAQAGSTLKEFNIGHLPATGHILYFIAYEEGFF